MIFEFCINELYKLEFMKNNKMQKAPMSVIKIITILVSENILDEDLGGAYKQIYSASSRVVHLKGLSENSQVISLDFLINSLEESIGILNMDISEFKE